MPFEKGLSGNPKGRPPGSYSSFKRIRKIILEVFHKNENYFISSLDLYMQTKPLECYQKIIYPLFPKQLEIEAEVTSSTKTSLDPTNLIKQLDSEIKKTEGRIVEKKSSSKKAYKQLKNNKKGTKT